MKYLLLAYTQLAEWDTVDVTSAEFQDMCRFYADLTDELTASGELVLTEGLAHPSLTRTVRPAADTPAPVALDGPFAEAKEVLVSFAILDTTGHERASDIAARIVAATGDTVEIRPVLTGGAAGEMAGG
ncbi:YciI family protein [Micromonospora sp. NPDC000089]|uniref:YciI family protein n=1 Tax=unclassified Micromonospora TaxID=2617518 RepID=UPI0036C2176D